MRFLLVLVALTSAAFAQCTSGQIPVRSTVGANTTTVCLAGGSLLTILDNYWANDTVPILNNNFSVLNAAINALSGGSATASYAVTTAANTVSLTGGSFGVGNVAVSSIAASSAANPTGTGTLYFYLLPGDTEVRVAEGSGISSAGTLTSLTDDGSQVGYPINALPLADCDVVGGTVGVCRSTYAGSRRDFTSAGTGLLSNCTSGICTLSVNGAAYPPATGAWDASAATSTKPAKTAASDPATCGESELYYNTALHKTRQCTGTNTWADMGTGSGSYYHNVQDEGTTLAQENTINFAGAGVTCTDGSSKTTCTIPGTGAPAGSPATKGDLWTSTGSATASQAVGRDGRVLAADSTQTNGLNYVVPRVFALATRFSNTSGQPTTETTLDSWTLPANTLEVGDFLDIYALYFKSGTANTGVYSIKLTGTSGVLLGGGTGASSDTRAILKTS